ncbi:MarR family winged helix-turn-helix transcriptional regulator [Nonomuraea jiangxiensis]|uniref:DNA-binding transcriptional regulator, MarR family n=1 Tax=Nonomuraea jiangxiensis TaxID=633440 RepID=A0A1G8XYW0_9ACTN|nr:MarR family winged helix-turn-helix transcriptional regulator [Nonomuraea jiangxiensis]SDJ95697.1 DNA-binding transcriptional regulator, MarR family [Nonomuraea jiangxiensis]
MTDSPEPAAPPTCPSPGGTVTVPAETAIPDTLLYQLVRWAKAHRTKIADELAGLGLYIGQEQLLAQLWSKDGLSQSELVDRLCVEPPTVTKMLQRMERAGLVRRAADPANARISRVYLSDRGRELQAPVERLWADSERRLSAELDPATRSALLDVLTRINTST